MLHLRDVWKLNGNLCVPCSTFASCVKVKEKCFCPLFYTCARFENQREIAVFLAVRLRVVYKSKRNLCVPCSTFTWCVKIKEKSLCSLFYICLFCENQREIFVFLVLHLPAFCVKTKEISLFSLLYVGVLCINQREIFVSLVLHLRNVWKSKGNLCVPRSTFVCCVKIKEKSLCFLFYICALFENQRKISVFLVVLLRVVYNWIKDKSLCPSFYICPLC